MTSFSEMVSLIVKLIRLIIKIVSLRSSKTLSKSESYNISHFLSIYDLITHKSGL